MNLRTDKVSDIVSHFTEMEGATWVEDSFRKNRHSILGALWWLDEIRQKASDVATLATKTVAVSGRKDWQETFDREIKYAVYTIYGAGGWNRYCVDGHGEVKFSRGHGTKDSFERAKRLDFAMV